MNSVIGSTPIAMAGRVRTLLPDGRLCTLWEAPVNPLYVLWELRDWEKGDLSPHLPWSGSLPQFESGVEGVQLFRAKKPHARTARC